MTEPEELDRLRGVGDPLWLTWQLSGLNLESSRGAIAQWCEKARKEWLEPRASALFGLEGLSDQPIRAASSSGVAASFGLVGAIGSRAAALPATEANWLKTLSDLRSGQGSYLGLQVSALDQDQLGSRPIVAGSVRIDFHTKQAALTAPASLHGDDWPIDQQQSTVRLWLELAEISSPMWGHATLDLHTATGFITAHELVAGRHLATQGAFARGYQWGTLLSEGHIERLGGVGRVRRQAPVIHIGELVAADRSTRLYLQLTSDIRQVSDSDLKKLKDYLRPILHPDREDYVAIGPQPRVVFE